MEDAWETLDRGVSEEAMPGVSFEDIPDDIAERFGLSPDEDL
jgi:hypothetical protein